MNHAPEKAKNGILDTDSIMAQEEVEVDLFYWDNSDEEEEEVMIGVVWEAELQAKQTQAEKGGKRKNNKEKEAANSTSPSKQSKKTVDVQSIEDNNATNSVAEQIQKRGKAHVDNKSEIKTPVEVQWVLKLGCTTFNVRVALLELLKRIATIDSTIYIKTGETKAVVRNPTDLPTAKDFTEVFKVTQKEEFNRPTRITIYFTLFSKVQLNTIKFDYYVWSYIQKNNVYVKHDAFLRNTMVSPGSIINVHPTLVRKEDYKAKIGAFMSEWPALDSEDATQ
eukprot:11852969-Ditylum_brightwellii.AAC.1